MPFSALTWANSSPETGGIEHKLWPRLPGISDRICDEMIAVDALEVSQRPFIAALGRCLRRYRALLRQHNMVDFAHLQVWAERVLRHDVIAADQGAAIRHLMVERRPGHVSGPATSTGSAGQHPRQLRPCGR